MCLVLCACAPKREEPRPGTISIKTGGLGPDVEISGVDNDDDTPVSIRID